VSDNLATLKTRMAKMIRIGQAAGLVGWDQETYMPPGAANARAEQSAALSEVTHELFVSDETGNLLAKAEADAVGMDDDLDDVRMLKKLRRDFDLQTKLPTELVTEMARHGSLTQELWKKSRANNDYVGFRPALEKMFDLTRQKAECYGYDKVNGHIYDALINEYETGAKQKEIAVMFANMKPGLVELLRKITESENQVDEAPIHGDFSVAKQRELTLKAVKAIGFDLSRGRQDEAAHPFCANFSRDDVRLTTRYDEKFLQQALYASLHEAGHGMYEQGSPERFEASVLAGGVSLGVHESQSRMWENLVGRSRPFVEWFFPTIKETFPDKFATETPERFYRAVNTVKPSFIRVEADEVTYNLHVLLRFELECALLEGSLSFDDLPETWNAKMQEYLGITPATDAEGCLQDVHWSFGLIGYFPTYSLGNLISTQLFASVRRALPDLDEQFRRGEFAPLLNWLRENVHGYGSKYLPEEVILKATGEKLTSRYYVDYMTQKYGDIYGV